MTAIVLDFFAATGRRAPEFCPTSSPEPTTFQMPRNRWLPLVLALSVSLLLAVASQLMFGQVPLRSLLTTGLLVFGNSWLVVSGGAAEAAAATIWAI